MAEQNTDYERGNAYAVPVTIHVLATSAAQADALVSRFANVIFDAGPVTLKSEGARLGLELLYVNGPDREITEDDASYEYPNDVSSHPRALALAERLLAQAEDRNG